MVWAIWWNQETLTGNFPQGSVLVSLPRPPQWELWDSPCEERMGLPWEDSRQPQNRAGTAHSWAVITCLTKHKPTVCQLCKRSEKMSHSHQYIKVREGRGGRGWFWGSGAEISPWRISMERFLWSRYILKNCSSWLDPHWSREKVWDRSSSK